MIYGGSRIVKGGVNYNVDEAVRVEFFSVIGGFVSFTIVLQESRLRN